ncbi:GNAT family N-acetyltransferase [Microbacterium sp. gxy059]|uniref:GNAT family N-acetyltransferase n=1 Tax=Microbacterium sp. gxy059 TaxID=2957199 RepID=UPI003D97CC7F
MHDASRTPFGFPWTDAPAEELPRNLAAYQWGLRGRVDPAFWAIVFAVHVDGRVVGSQELSAHDFANRRTVNSGSWLTSSAQGRGLGTEIHAALLLFAFDVLGAEWAESSAAAWNERSLAVSRRRGYRDNGVTRVSPRPGEPVDEQRVRLSKGECRRPSWSIAVRGADRALAQLGVSAA